jgi:hypothetical protein
VNETVRHAGMPWWSVCKERWVASCEFVVSYSLSRCHNHTPPHNVRGMASTKLYIRTEDFKCYDISSCMPKVCPKVRVIFQVQSFKSAWPRRRTMTTMTNFHDMRQCAEHSCMPTTSSRSQCLTNTHENTMHDDMLLLRFFQVLLRTIICSLIFKM